MSLIVTPALDVEHVIKIQRERVANCHYKMFGRIKVIVFEPACGAAVPGKDETDVWGVRFDWMGWGPLIALSRDDAELLFVTPVDHPPDIPDPAWVPAFAGERCPKQKYIHQSYADRASGKLRGTNFLIFQPVAQILFRPMTGGGFGLISTRTNNANGTKMALLIDPTKNAGHLYGGAFNISN